MRAQNARKAAVSSPFVGSSMTRSGGRVHERTRELEAPAESSREPLDGIAGPLGEAGLLEQARDAGGPLARGHAVERGREAQVLLRAELPVEPGLLEHDPGRALGSPRAPGAIARPSRRKRPDAGRSAPASRAKSVDFPAPFGPSSPKISPARTSSDTSRRTSRSFLRKDTPRSERRAGGEESARESRRASRVSARPRGARRRSG